LKNALTTAKKLGIAVDDIFQNSRPAVTSYTDHFDQHSTDPYIQTLPTCFYSILYLFRGWQGMLAYGCQNLVTVVETKTVQVIQTLERHRSPVVRVSLIRAKDFVQ
jgi:hypothetical protein